jgi:hypothetical protein
LTNGYFCVILNKNINQNKNTAKEAVYMKKLFVILLSIAIVSLTACTKTVTVEKESTVYSENGIQYKGFRIDHPVDTVSYTTFSRFTSSFTGYGNMTEFMQFNNNRKLVHFGSKWVFLVRATTPVSGYLEYENVKNELQKRGWTLAPVSYLAALKNEYASELINSGEFIICSDSHSRFINPQTNTSTTTTTFLTQYNYGTYNFETVVYYDPWSIGGTAYFLCYR